MLIAFSRLWNILFYFIRFANYSIVGSVKLRKRLGHENKAGVNWGEEEYQQIIIWKIKIFCELCSIKLTSTWNFSTNADQLLLLLLFSSKLRCDHLNNNQIRQTSTLRILHIIRSLPPLIPFISFLGTGIYVEVLCRMSTQIVYFFHVSGSELSDMNIVLSPYLP